MYETALLGRPPGTPGRGPVGVHEGATRDFLARHHAVAARAAGHGPAGARELAPQLLGLIADPRALRLAWDRLAARGGAAPGPDGWRYDEFADAEVWDLCRECGAAVRKGVYRPGDEAVTWVAKGPGRGARPLVLQSIVDRVVQRAALAVLQPVLDPLFEPTSFGFRPGRGRADALAAAERLALGGGRRWWVTADVRDAFLHVPLPRLFQVVRSYLPSDDLLNFLGAVVPGRRLPGLRQGGPLSPLLLNLYLHHALDRPWRLRGPDAPLVRVADDLLVLARTRADAEAARADLARGLTAAGLPLKDAPGGGVHALTAADPAHWLGYRVRRGRAGLVAELGPAAWAGLARRLERAHERPDAPRRAAAVVLGWLDQAGPCYPRTERARAAAVRRVARVAARLAFDEIPGPGVLRLAWRRAWRRWGRLRRRPAD